MITEISKIIEGGLARDSRKVANYSRALLASLDPVKDRALVSRISGLLAKNQNGMVSLDSLSARPVDSDSRMDILQMSNPAMSMSDLVLDDYVIDSVNRFVSMYRRREDLLRAGLTAPSKMLLYGRPGCGKTSVARLVASLIGIPLVTAQLDGMVSSLLGNTSKNIRKIFDYASRQPCVLFLDEFDVVAKMRDDVNELGELKRVVNSLIQNIDEFDEDCVLIAATNHHEMLDRAIWRRFACVLELLPPSAETIPLLIRKVLGGRKTDFEEDAKLSRIASALSGLSHSDVTTVVLNAVRSSVLAAKDYVSSCEILKECYLFRKHVIVHDTELVGYLIERGMSHRKINSELGISLRTIRKVSGSMQRERKS